MTVLTDVDRPHVAPVALVTGAGRRLGRRIAQGLAERGCDLVLHANNSVDGARALADELRVYGRRAWVVQGDLSRADELPRIAGEAVAAAGRLDVLVNNAGVFPEAAFDDVTVEQWNAALDINARAVFFLTQACAPALRTARGSVVNIASMGGVQPWVRHIPYNVSKAAAIMVTRALAKALAPEVRVNGVAPGIILVPGEETRIHPSPERIPLRRYGDAGELVRAVLFLALDATYISGHILPVDGGAAGAL